MPQLVIESSSVEVEMQSKNVVMQHSPPHTASLTLFPVRSSSYKVLLPTVATVMSVHAFRARLWFSRRGISL